MKKIFKPQELSELHDIFSQSNLKVVVVGGCFDILHPGHIAFLEAAKTKGDMLVLLVESDDSVRRMKGKGRPVHNQAVRAQELAKLQAPDIIITLGGVLTDRDYDELILRLKPAIIATTEGDAYEHHKKRQADLTGAQLIPVIKRLPEHSTSKIIKNRSL
jgi:rfaE bifunctional protein nucleotidyltransferase chain/domain